ncbi:MAG: hypothetical protein COX82_03625 [Candidatus Magasanikbacteria bacterium CG_4_10_14_0_2_um_filter_41_10]|uniref:Glycosyltransferase 2-like domain-containing protein n=1 Tax=Candidatus Magasanikbacteria bacterium CG_4_10_14_0_2_um_filter_41_10 TaxID=1974638 RepID=A0A2M7V380_9BACT|nr:MAG: hypothetical protein COX82_03625 [Candidatus Magasanikbacteria bacterium CG_4_10_14_0_2_um_filter_41_10]
MLTIITSIYKSETYLKKYTDHLMRVGDVLSQQLDFECIVIANDPSQKEIDAFHTFQGKKWFTFMPVPREPLYATWNRGISMAKGNVIGFWNVDDIRYAEALLDGVHLIQNGADLVYFPFTISWYVNVFGTSFLVKKKEIKPDQFERAKFVTGMHCGPFFLFSRDLYERVGAFDEQFRIAGDFDWCVRAATVSEKFRLSSMHAGIFRVDGGGLSAGGKRRLQLENSVVFKRHAIPIDVGGLTDAEISSFNEKKMLYKGKYIDVFPFDKVA